MTSFIVISACLSNTARPLTAKIRYVLGTLMLGHGDEMFGPIQLVYPHHFFILVPVPSQESQRSCICVRGADFTSTIFLLQFGTVRTVWYLFSSYVSST